MICVTAARAGKDIYCEKPLTWSLGEGRAVVKAVRENKVIFQVGSMQRSFGNMKQACELIRNGCIGKVHPLMSPCRMAIIRWFPMTGQSRP